MKHQLVRPLIISMGAEQPIDFDENPEKVLDAELKSKIQPELEHEPLKKDDSQIIHIENDTEKVLAIIGDCSSLPAVILYKDIFEPIGYRIEQIIFDGESEEQLTTRLSDIFNSCSQVSLD